MKTLIYYNGKLLHTVVHPKSFSGKNEKDVKEAVLNTREKIKIVPVTED
jgi:hypothetical protein